ncbi:hypothetical protein LCGC14_0318180 [marine sediment metagenome]|uniref:Uncharacterized protein n=1 Tax=marine sediment metagenome TaxID=412755 RepID=A0A0F9TQD6_9ZZZZ
MIRYYPDGGKPSRPIWGLATTQDNYVVRIIAWSETKRILSEKWGAGSFGAGLLLYLYTKDGE